LAIDSIIYLPLLFFLNHTATPNFYPLSLHDALPIYQRAFHGLRSIEVVAAASIAALAGHANSDNYLPIVVAALGLAVAVIAAVRSEEHTSELQSLTNLVCRLLLEKKKHTRHHTTYHA